jgi:hypothetical protein
VDLKAAVFGRDVNSLDVETISCEQPITLSMKVRLAGAFGAGFVAAIIIGVLRPVPKPQCAVGDLSREVDATEVRNIGSKAWAWVHDARVCHVGDYVVVAPDRRGLPDIVVARSQHPVLVVAGNAIFVQDKQRVVYEWDHDRSIISYAGYDSMRAAWIDNLDMNADGVLDYRTTEIVGQPAKREVWMAERWLEMQTKGEHSGVIVNGAFMSLSDARKLLAPGVEWPSRPR